MQVSDDKGAFTPMELLFLKIDTHHCHFDFRLLDEYNSIIILKNCYLQLLTKSMSIYNKTSKIYPDLNPVVPQEPQRYCSKNTLKLRHICFDETL